MSVCAVFDGCDSGIKTQQSQYKARMSCQRFVSCHLLFVTVEIREFMCHPSQTGIPTFLSVSRGTLELSNSCVTAAVIRRKSSL